MLAVERSTQLGGLGRLNGKAETQAGEERQETEPENKEDMETASGTSQAQH